MQHDVSQCPKSERPPTPVHESSGERGRGRNSLIPFACNWQASTSPRLRRCSPMAQKVLVQLVDDLDGTTSDSSISTVQFALDGVTYEIDLTDSNDERLRGLFSDYVTSARRTGGRVKR